jgi:HEAT repeat protein
MILLLTACGENHKRETQDPGGMQSTLPEETTDPKDAEKEEKLQELIEKLKDKDIKTRCDAAKALGALGDVKAVNPLIKALKDESYYEGTRITRKIGAKAIRFRVTRFAAEALGKIGDTKAVQPLIEVLKDSDWRIRLSAMLALGDIGDPAAVNPLLEAAKNQRGARFIYDDRAVLALAKIGKTGVPALIAALKRPDVASFAVRALQRIKDRRAVEPLIEALQDRHVAIYAARALGAIGDKKAVEPLIKALEAGHARDAAAWALGDLGDKKAVPPLLKLLNEDGVLSPGVMLALGKLKAELAVESLVCALKREEWQIHGTAASALGYLGDARAVGPLIELLKEKKFRSRRSAVSALGRIGKPAVQPLVEALDGGEVLFRRYVVEALGKTGDESAVKPLLKMLNEEDDFIRSAVPVALAATRDKRSVQPLIEMLRKDSDRSVQFSAAFALGELRDERAIPHLIDALKVGYRDVRDKAAEALVKITGKDFGTDYGAWHQWYEKNKDK